MKKLIVLKGEPNSYKTTVLNEVYSRIKTDYNLREVYYQKLGGRQDDFIVVFLIGTIVCGIVSEGDFGYNVGRSISLFDRLESLSGCDVVICACSLKVPCNPEDCVNDFVNKTKVSITEMRMSRYRYSQSNKMKIEQKKDDMIIKIKTEFDKQITLCRSST